MLLLKVSYSSTCHTQNYIESKTYTYVDHTGMLFGCYFGSFLGHNSSRRVVLRIDFPVGWSTSWKGVGGRKGLHGTRQKNKLNSWYSIHGIRRQHVYIPIQKSQIGIYLSKSKPFSIMQNDKKIPFLLLLFVLWWISWWKKVIFLISFLPVALKINKIRF